MDDEGKHAAADRRPVTRRKKTKAKREKKPHVLTLRNDNLRIEGWENVKIKEWDDVTPREPVIECRIVFPPTTHAVLFNYGVPNP